MADKLMRVGCIVDGEVGTITAAGEIDISTCGRLESTIAGVLATRVTVLVLDLQRVEFIASAGLACLIATMKTCHERGVRVEFVASEPTRRLLELCRLPDPNATSASGTPLLQDVLVEAVAEARARTEAVEPAGGDGWI